MHAPNPVMSIEGIGIIGMPLTDRDSQLLLSHSSPGDSGEGMVVDSDNLPGSMIEPKNISFQNPKWDEFVDKMASDTIWNSLVATKWKTKPKVELVKASVHHAGSKWVTLLEKSHTLPDNIALRIPSLHACVVFFTI